MQIIFFSADMTIIDEWKSRHGLEHSFSCYDEKSLQKVLKGLLKSFILVVDFNSVDKEINRLITSGALPENVIVLEKVPAIATGKMLISHGVKAYGNSRMLSNHYRQMIDTVTNAKVWTYPELTAALIESSKKKDLNSYAKELIESRLTKKEKKAVYLILKGLTNDAIASKLDITTRTVKAHVSSIFTKLHVSDRVSLVLLLK